MNEQVRELLQRVAGTADFCYVTFDDINATNVLGDNALHCVIVWGDLDAVKLLVQNGIEVNQRGEHGYTPLHTACEFGHKEIVGFLLDKGADPNARTDGDLPFTVARLGDHDELCDFLSKRLKDRERTEAERKHHEHLAKLDECIAELGREIKEHCGKQPP